LFVSRASSYVAASGSIAPYTAATARPSAVIRLAGMMLPGNGCPVSGSRIGVLNALKLPCRIARVGSVRCVGFVDRRMYRHSSPAKKNSFPFTIGPPRLPPKLLYFSGAFATFCTLAR
jgi:hypothetical protein